MKQIAWISLVLMAGCSTAPLADVLDVVRPGRLGQGPYRGGVEIQHAGPQGPPAPPSAAMPELAPAPSSSPF